MTDPEKSHPTDTEQQPPAPVSASADDAEPQEGEAPSPVGENESAKQPSDAPPKASETGTDDDLPDDWEMTPEFAEEEAIRGDFVIRWAVILLAVLLGWTHITSTAVLTRIRTGESLAANGILPPRTDTFFSYTAPDREWHNTAWLGDLLLGGVYRLGNDPALTVVNALLCGLAFWLLSRISLKEMPTWASSVFQGMTVLAVFPLLASGPTMITVLGLALVLFLLYSSAGQGSAISPWWLVPVMLLWSNMDERVYLGSAVILSALLGDVLTSAPQEERKRRLVPGLAALLATLVNPFPKAVVLAPWELSQTVAPLMREFGDSLLNDYPFLWQRPLESAAWQSHDWFLPAGLLLAGFAASSLMLNRRHLDRRLLVLFIGMNLLGLLTSADFLAVSLCNAVIAGLSCQHWYRENCQLEYSIDSKELMFSRGGRAVTVIGLFFLAYWTISGRLTGADGRRVGFGFSNRLQFEIDGYADLLGEIPADEFDDRPFHMTPRQGDLLIWHHRRTFTDSRLPLFAQGDSNLLRQQQEIIQNMQNPTEDQLRDMTVEEWQSRWQAPLDQWQVTHFVIPLDSIQGFRLWVSLSTQAIVSNQSAIRFWQPTRLSGPAAMLNRLDPSTDHPDKYARFLKSQPTGDILADTFRKDRDGKETRRAMFPTGPTFYETKLLWPEPEFSNEIQTAYNYQLRSRTGQRSDAEMVAYCHKIIRHARRGLTDYPNHALGYRLLGEAYAQLQEIESRMFSAAPFQPIRHRRFLQSLFAWQQASICDPDDPMPHDRLFVLALQNQKLDLALYHLNRLEEIVGALTLFPREASQYSAQQQARKQQREKLEEAIGQIHAAIQRTRQDQGLSAAVSMAMMQGCPLKGLELIEEDLTVLSGDLELSLQYASLLLYDGRAQDAYSQISSMMSGVPEPLKYRAERIAAEIKLAPDEMDMVADHWDNHRQLIQKAAVQARLTALPMVSGPAPPEYDIWPALQPALVYRIATEYEPRWELSQIQIALCDLEQGRNRQAGEQFEQILENNPDTGLRVLISMYLTLISGEPVDMLSPSQRARFQEMSRQRFPDRPPSPRPPEQIRPD